MYQLCKKQKQNLKKSLIFGAPFLQMVVRRYYIKHLFSKQDGTWWLFVSLCAKLSVLLEDLCSLQRHRTFVNPLLSNNNKDAHLQEVGK